MTYDGKTVFTGFMITLAIGLGFLVAASSKEYQAQRAAQLKQDQATCLQDESNKWDGRECITPSIEASEKLRMAEYEWCNASPEHFSHERCAQFVIESDDGPFLTLMIAPGISVTGPAIGIGGGIGIGL